MEHTALGVRMHSGWGVLVAISEDLNSLEVLARKRIVTTGPEIPGAKQPYHFAASLEFPEAERYLARCAAASESLASEALREAVTELDRYQVVGSAVLLASGHHLPPLSKILASHPLIHTAEGEFFRNAVTKACERLKIPVTTMRERELDEFARETFGNETSRVLDSIASLGRLIGPPWTSDHKSAALAAAIVLDRRRTATPSHRARKSGPQ